MICIDSDMARRATVFNFLHCGWSMIQLSSGLFYSILKALAGICSLDVGF
jgi:hypothetical protein